jgi:hypothetical protein
VVLARLASPAPIAFFDTDEEATARVLLDRLLGQEDEPRVPMLEQIDARLLACEGDGYRYDAMPEDGEAWKRSLAGLDADSAADHDAPFWRVSRADQKALVERVRTASGEWHGMPGAHVYQLWMRYALTAFYSHPWAWNEIGFPGPAYPRGYKSFGSDRLESFEVREHDPRDPIPWIEKVDAAEAEHAEGPGATRSE